MSDRVTIALGVGNDTDQSSATLVGSALTQALAVFLCLAWRSSAAIFGWPSSSYP